MRSALQLNRSGLDTALRVLRAALSILHLSYVARHPGAFACRKCTHADGCTELAKPDPQIPNQLSARESEVLALLAERLPNKQISARLAINAATVRTHLMRIYKKVNVYCRTEAGAKFLRAGTKNTGR